MHRWRIILVDDHRVLMDAIKTLIEPEFEVVGTFESAAELLAAAPAIKPDAIIMDIGMPKGNGLSVGPKLKKLLPKTKLIYLTMYSSMESASQAFKLGASGYILKSTAGKELLRALREIQRGGYYATPELTEGMIGSFVQNFKNMEEPHKITARQKEVLHLISDGLSMKEIALRLDIQYTTVVFHKYTMMRQLGIKTSAELISYALSSLPKPPE
ncbi:MAG: DNA-binding response regulator [Acidobacteria bacterium]|nr:MAG: DNA-binding response regulator [Acidobacteriota bacterium]